MKFRTLSLFCVVLLVATAGCGKDEKEPEPLWTRPHQKITQNKDALIVDLEVIHEILTGRAKVENPELLEILEPEPPKPLEYGYGVLPEINKTAPLKDIQPKETYYYIRWLETEFDPEYVKASELKDTVQQQATAPLKPLVDEYGRLKKRLALLESHLSYHLQWQKALVETPAFFARKNKLVAKVRTVIKYKGDMDALRKDMSSEIARFIPAKDLQISNNASGTKELDVTLHTDITDQAFLAALQEAIETEFNASKAAKAKQFRLNLNLIIIDPNTLYPNGVPQKGDEIDIKAHVALFPKDSLVLSTGAKSTYAMQGRHVLLGPNPVTRRTLAHEFGHLLGFNDVYLRGYDGSPHNAYGATIVEWTGLYNDLMGNPGGGEVSDLMIDTLIGAYTK